MTLESYRNFVTIVECGSILAASNKLLIAQPSLSNHCLLYTSVLTLSKKETALLGYFMKNPGRTLTREALLSYIWGSSSEVEDGNLDNYIYFLRRRLKALDAPVKLSTVHGVGYRLEACNRQEE